jgi:hypothetical protein
LYREGSLDEILDARVVLPSLLSPEPEPEPVSDFDVIIDSDLSSAIDSRPLDFCAASESVGADMADFGSKGLPRVF